MAMTLSRELNHGMTCSRALLRVMPCPDSQVKGCDTVETRMMEILGQRSCGAAVCKPAGTATCTNSVWRGDVFLVLNVSTTYSLLEPYSREGGGGRSRPRTNADHLLESLPPSHWPMYDSTSARQFVPSVQLLGCIWGVAPCNVVYGVARCRLEVSSIGQSSERVR